ncbi:MAG TPA: glycoside hydrolase [Cryomorphaceae bacterium]|nr:glycoside hydrolase [Cryomorphaceae bacterium]
MSKATQILAVFLWCLAILGCEAPTTPRLSASDLEIDEGHNTHTVDFYVYLSEAAPRPVTVDYQTSEVNATEGEDFESIQGTLEIPKGESVGVFTITIYGDEDSENTESFWISFSNPSNATVPEPYAQVVLLNDDGAPPIDGSGFSTPNSYPGMSLVWEEQFDDEQLNLQDWSYETGTGSWGWGNNESQCYRSGTNNAELDQGYLRITAKQETYLGAPFTSARIITKEKRSFQYGRIDIRAKLPHGQGIWPALWMLGDDYSTAGWPSCGEIDIMELIGGEGYNDRTVYGTAHWSNNGSHASYGGNTSLPNGEMFNDEFHVFSIVWNSNSIKWYVDNSLYHTLNIANLSAFHQKFFFILNIAVEGNWPGPIGPSTQFPQYMLVDYIRVFQ